MLRVVLFAEWKGSLSAALCCEFTEPLSSLCAVLLKHGENPSKQGRREMKPEELFTFSGDTVVFTELLSNI